MRHIATALVHVRGLWAALGLTVTGLLFVWFFGDLTFPVSLAPLQPGRPVGAFDIGVVLTAATLPALTEPHWGGREHLARTLPRLVHTALAAGLLLPPLLVYLAWYAAVLVQLPSQILPPVASFLGNVFSVAALGLAATVLAGRVIGPIITGTAFLGLALTQQVWPRGWSARHFSTGDDWVTDPYLTLALVAAALLAFHLTRGVPRYRAKYL